MQIKTKAYTYLIVSILIGSFTPVLLLSTQGANAFELFFLASLASLPVGYALLAANGKRGLLTGLLSNRKMLFYMALAALLMYVPYEYGIAYAEHFISAPLAVVLFRLNPLLMLILLPIFLRERLTRKQILALCIGFVGIFIGITQGNFSQISTANLTMALFVAMLALGYALSNVLIKWQMFDNETFLATSSFVLAAFFGIAFVASGMKTVPLSRIDIGIILYLAVTNIFSFYMYMRAFKILKTTMVTNAFLASPFFSFIWANLLYGQAIGIYSLAIAVLAGFGIVIQSTDTLGGSYAAKKGDAPRRFVIFDVTGAFVDGEVQSINEVIKSGGRVFATKLSKANAENAASLISGTGNVYTGEEGRLLKEGDFVRDVLGADEGETVIIKAGQVQENEEFFNKLNTRIAGE